MRASLIDDIPSSDNIRARLNTLAEESRVLRSLWKVARKAEQLKRTTPKKQGGDA